MRIARLPVFVIAALACSAAAAARADGPSVEYPIEYIESRLSGPLEVAGAEQARPSIEGDRSARVRLVGSEGQPDFAVHWKPVAPPGRGFNNEPRYEVAAYRLQKMFLDECEYVVPPVALRALSVAEYRRLKGEAPPTVRGASSVLFLVSYWLSNVTNRDPWDPARFKADPRYARHWGNLNILTHLVDHKDANIGNLLISTYAEDPRVFSVDNDVAFGSEASDRGDTWRRLLVDELPQATVERLRTLNRADLDRELGVVAEFRIVDGQLEAREPGDNLGPRNAVRTRGDRVQFGLTSAEIQATERRISRLLSRVDRGQIKLVPDSPASIGLSCAGSASP